MRILIATHHLVRGAGTETYVRTLATALARRDHEVTVYSPFVGAVADDIRRSGIPVTDDIGSLRHEFFSVAHVHHNVIATQVRATLRKCAEVERARKVEDARGIGDATGKARRRVDDGQLPRRAAIGGSIETHHLLCALR